MPRHGVVVAVVLGHYGGDNTVVGESIGLPDGRVLLALVVVMNQSPPRNRANLGRPLGLRRVVARLPESLAELDLCCSPWSHHGRCMADGIHLLGLRYFAQCSPLSSASR